MRTRTGRVDREQLLQIGMLLVEVRGDRGEDLCVSAIGGPAQVPFGYRLPGAKLFGQVTPRRPGAVPPDNALQRAPMIIPGAATTPPRRHRRCYQCPQLTGKWAEVTGRGGATRRSRVIFLAVVGLCCGSGPVSGDGFEGDAVAQGGELGDVVADPAFGVDAGRRGSRHRGRGNGRWGRSAGSR